MEQQLYEPVAWMTFDGEGSYELRLYEYNESYREDYIKKNGPKYKDWVKPLYTLPTTLQKQIDEVKVQDEESVAKISDKELRKLQTVKQPLFSGFLCDLATELLQLRKDKNRTGNKVAKIVRNESGQISIQGVDGKSFDMSECVGATIYVTYPDVTTNS